MKLIKNGIKNVSSIKTIIGSNIKEIKEIRAIVGGKIIQVWTAVKDFVTGVFSQGYWQNSEGWNNDDAWKNQP